MLSRILYGQTCMPYSVVEFQLRSKNVINEIDTKYNYSVWLNKDHYNKNKNNGTVYLHLKVFQKRKIWGDLSLFDSFWSKVWAYSRTLSFVLLHWCFSKENCAKLSWWLKYVKNKTPLTDSRRSCGPTILQRCTLKGNETICNQRTYQNN